MQRQIINSGFQMQKAGDDNWIAASVPGTVYTDLLREGLMEDPFWKDNENKAWELMDNDYVYETCFHAGKVCFCATKCCFALAESTQLQMCL